MRSHVHQSVFLVVSLTFTRYRCILLAIDLIECYYTPTQIAVSERKAAWNNFTYAHFMAQNIYENKCITESIFCRRNPYNLCRL